MYTDASGYLYERTAGGFAYGMGGGYGGYRGGNTLPAPKIIADAVIGTTVAIAAMSAAQEISIGIGEKVYIKKKEKAEAKAEEKEEVATLPQNTAIYYGAIPHGASLSYITPPMDIAEITLWALTTAELNKFGNRYPWGIYTDKQEDALKLVIALGGPNPIHHECYWGTFNHYHVYDYTFAGKYKHFHIWYGDYNS